MGKHVHRLSELNREARTAVCASCGPVKVKSDGRSGSFRCGTAAVKRELARRQQPGHKERYTAWAKDYHTRTEGYAQRKALLKTYGITPEQYDEMAAAQDWKCRCGRPIPRSRAEGHRFPVDHCHETGVNRGILCPSCNRALGLLGDNVDTMYALIEHVLAGQSKGP